MAWQGMGSCGIPVMYHRRWVFSGRLSGVAEMCQSHRLRSFFCRRGGNMTWQWMASIDRIYCSWTWWWAWSCWASVPSFPLLTSLDVCLFWEARSKEMVKRSRILLSRALKSVKCRRSWWTIRSMLMKWSHQQTPQRLCMPLPPTEVLEGLEKHGCRWPVGTRKSGGQAEPTCLLPRDGSSPFPQKFGLWCFLTRWYSSAHIESRCFPQCWRRTRGDRKAKGQLAFAMGHWFG